MRPAPGLAFSCSSTEQLIHLGEWRPLVGSQRRAHALQRRRTRVSMVPSPHESIVSMLARLHLNRCPAKALCLALQMVPVYGPVYA